MTYGSQHRKWRNTYPGGRKRKLLFEIGKKGKLKAKKVVKNYYIR